MIKNVSQQNKQCHTPPSQRTFIKLFSRNQMHYNYKLHENILNTLIQRNILPTNPNKKIKFIIYYNRYKTSNLVIKNNSFLSIGDCISENNNIYVGLTSTTQWRRHTMHLSDTSSISQHLQTFIPNN